MADHDWRVIEATAKGWRILKEHDRPNIRSNAMLPLIEPIETDEGIEILRVFINASDDGFVLTVAWLLATLYPDGPFPILVFTGEQGSAKSGITKMLRNLVYPSFVPLRSLPKDEENLLIAAQHVHIIALDNLSHVDGAMSDVLCRVSTGGGFGARTKFTDGDESVFFAKNPIVLNGITNFASRPDLASRALPVRLDPIPDELRRTEAEVERAWASVAPRVLGVLLGALSHALARLPETRPPKMSRMADFERLMEAASPFLGWAPGAFAAAYLRSRNESDAAAIEAEPLAIAIIDVLDERLGDRWDGTASRLLEVLGEKVSDSVRRSRLWPTGAGSLGMRLERIKPVLRRHGVEISRSHSGSRNISTFRTSDPRQPHPTRTARKDED